jgi:hypothetical protein
MVKFFHNLHYANRAEQTVFLLTIPINVNAVDPYQNKNDGWGGPIQIFNLGRGLPRKNDPMPDIIFDIRRAF